MFDEEKGVYTIGTVAELMGVHPETLRVWEKNCLVMPAREKTQRRYSNSDILRIKFIKCLLYEKGLNVAGAKQVVSMYSCWYRRTCNGGLKRDASDHINESKPCWKAEERYCFAPSDKAEMCSSCSVFNKCAECARFG